MINKYKKYTILFSQLPLTVIGYFVKSIVALGAFTYFRWVRSGIALGKKLDTYLDCHEKGYKIEK